MADCLLEILKEVQLEKYYKSFVDSGLSTCEALVNLSMQEYSQYGVASMQDRLRLFKLIQIVKSVQDEGIICRHKHTTGSTSVKEEPKKSSRTDPQRRASQSSDCEQNQKFGDSADNKFQRAPFSKQSQKVITNNNNTTKGNVQLKSEKKTWEENELFAPKPVLKPPKTEVMYKKGSDSPIFKCRKTLNFSVESDADSDEVMGDKGGASITSVSGNSRNESRESSDNVSRSHNDQSENHVPHKVQFNAKNRPRSFVMETDKSSATVLRNTSQDGSPALPLPAQTARLVTADTKPVKIALSPSPVNSPSPEAEPHHVIQIPATTLPPSVSAASLSHVPRAAFFFEPLHTIKTTEKESKTDHAYFPTFNPSPVKETCVERIYHNSGYNYGVPKPSPAASDKQDLQTLNPSELDKIRVCVRKRPLTARESKRKEIDVVKVPNRNTVIVEENKLAVDLSKYIQEHVFAFDEVFSEENRNEDVYARAVRPLLDCVFNKGCATCFAFGQTGAGKSYTLLGTKSVPGLYQLAAQEIFELMNAEDYGGGLRLWVSYYEIYCGQLFDLLNKRKKLQVRENTKQKVCIAGLMETQVRDIKTLVDVIQYGNATRKTGTTGVNLSSSRSHAILQLEVRDTRDFRVGRLSFIDLAGSERAADVTNFNKTTRMEGAEINQSLLALKECIRSIDQDSSHTPYRQSKLTHILRDSFVGNSRTVMIANISPAQTACENSLNTLRYADRVKELKRDSPNKSAMAKVQSAQPSPLVEPQSFSSVQTPKDGRKMAPSLFHPSNIQFSSTPKLPPRRGSNQANHSNGRTGDTASPVNLSKVLKEAYETPIRGHKLQKTERRRGKEGVLGYPPVVVRRESGYKSSPASSSRHSDNHYHSSGSSSGSRRTDRRYRHERDRHVSGDSVPDRERKEDKMAATTAPLQDVTPPHADPRKRLFSMSANDSDPIPIIDISSITKHSEGSQHNHSNRKLSSSPPPPPLDLGRDLGLDLSSPRRAVSEDSLSKHSRLETSNHSKSNSDIIEEHREIMSQLDVVLDKAKAAMNKAAATPLSSAQQTDDQTQNHASTKEAGADYLQLRKHQELLRANKSSQPPEKDRSNDGAPAAQQTKHSKVSLPSPRDVEGTMAKRSQDLPLGSKEPNGISILIQRDSHTSSSSSSSSSRDSRPRDQKSTNVKIVEQAFSKLNEASSATHRPAPVRKPDNKLFDGSSQVDSNGFSYGRASTYKRDNLETEHESEESPNSSGPRFINIPVERTSNFSERRHQSPKDTGTNGEAHDDGASSKGMETPPSEEFLKSLVGLKMARELLNENLAKEESERHSPPGDLQSDLQRNYKLHLTMMNKNLKAAHLRPFEDLLGSPSNARKEDSEKGVVSPSEVPVSIESVYSSKREPTAAETRTEFSSARKDQNFIPTARNETQQLRNEVTLRTDEALSSALSGPSERAVPKKPKSPEVTKPAESRLSWSEVLSVHNNNNHLLDVNQNVQKNEALPNTQRISEVSLRSITNTKVGATLGNQNVKSEVDSGFATQDTAKAQNAKPDSQDESDKHSDTSTLDDVASLPGVDEGATSKVPKGRKLQVHADSAFTKVAGPVSTNNFKQGARPTSTAVPKLAKIETAAPPTEEKVDSSISPIKTEKLVDTGAMFSPIHPFPVTPCENQVISVPSVITKTLLTKDSSELSDISMQSSSAHSSMQYPAEKGPSNGLASSRRVGQSVVHEKLRDSNLQLTSSSTRHKNKTRMLQASKTGQATGEDSNHSAAPSQRSRGNPENRSAISKSPTTTTTTNGSSDYNNTSNGGSQQKSALYKSQNLLVFAHEEQLSEITSLCKKEMQLLMKMKSGETGFQEYMEELQEVLSSKAQCIATLSSQIEEFQNISHSE